VRELKQLDTAVQIIKSANQNQPFANSLSQYFRQNKQMGSRDRRLYSELCYSNFRIGKSILNASVEEKIIAGYFLINQIPSDFLQAVAPDLNEEISKSIEDKFEIIRARHSEFNPLLIYQFKTPFSDSIDPLAFSISHLIKPLVFLRVDVNYSEKINLKLKELEITHFQLSETCIAVEPITQLEPLRQAGIKFEVQDLSSQYTGTYFKPEAHERWWDCCAGSGGKSLLIHSLEPEIKLLVSDMRETILENLKERFQLAGISKYQLKEIDLMNNFDAQMPGYEFDGIILDAPCSGSGTWGRAPEMLTFFDENKIKMYNHLQFTIAKNISKYLMIGKPLIYITCSVFKQENETMIEKIAKELAYTIEKFELIKGYHNRADSMFVARLIKN